MAIVPPAGWPPMCCSRAGHMAEVSWRSLATSGGNLPGTSANMWEIIIRNRSDFDEKRINAQNRKQIKLLLVGGWATPLKNMKVNWDDEIPNIWENKKCSKPPTSLRPSTSDVQNTLFWFMPATIQHHHPAQNPHYTAPPLDQWFNVKTMVFSKTSLAVNQFSIFTGWWL